MKVLIINKTIGFGSVGKIVEDLYSGIIESGNDCTIAYAKKKKVTKVKECDCIKIGSGFDRLVHAFFSLVIGRHGFYSKRVTKQLVKYIELYNPDIIHIHGVYGYYINMQILFNTISKMNIKLVSTLHSCWDFTGHCCYFDFVNCSEWKTDCKKCIQKNSYPKAFIDNTKKNYLTKMMLYNSIKDCVIVTPSVWLKDLINQSFLNTKKTFVINNGINLDVFNIQAKNASLIKQKYGLVETKPCILCVANIWEKRKGLSDILELANEIQNDIQLVIVGLNKKQNKKIPDNVISIAHTANMDELASLYSFATVLFNPTYEDNYPTVNLESIACHTPVITYDTGGCKETIQDGKYGFVIQKQDYQALIKNVRKIFDKEIVFDFSDLSYIQAKVMVEKYIELYKSII